MGKLYLSESCPSLDIEPKTDRERRKWPERKQNRRLCFSILYGVLTSLCTWDVVLIPMVVPMLTEQQYNAAIALIKLKLKRNQIGIRKYYQLRTELLRRRFGVENKTVALPRPTEQDEAVSYLFFEPLV